MDDQILLLKSCCMEIMCLRAACRYDPEKETITMHNGVCLHKTQLKSEGLGLLVEPIFEFAVGLSKLKLDKTELALLAAVLLMQSGIYCIFLLLSLSPLLFLISEEISQIISKLFFFRSLRVKRTGSCGETPGFNSRSV